MITPDFFNDVPPIVMRDPLAELLGAVDGGLIEYTYTDAVKLAGHSCPTVAGAYLMVQKGLCALYGNLTPVRGEIKIIMRGKPGEGVAGVIANVTSMITGAADVGGFHGLAGKFDRRHLISYEADLAADMALERTDTGVRALLGYDPTCVSGDERIRGLLSAIGSGDADATMRELFGALWQDRVRRILIEGKNDPRLVKCTVK